MFPVLPMAWRMHSEFVLSLFSSGGCFLDLLLLRFSLLTNSNPDKVFAYHVCQAVNVALQMLLLCASSISKNLFIFKFCGSYTNSYTLRRGGSLASAAASAYFCKALTIVGTCLLDWALWLDE